MTNTGKKRGPKPKVSIPDQIEELEKHIIFNEDCTLKTGKEHEKLWQLICRNLGFKIKPLCILTNVSQNRNGMQDKLLKKFKVKLKTDHSKFSNADSSSAPDTSQTINQNLEIKALETKSLLDILIDIRSNVLYKPIIKDFAQYPFSLFYWPQKQSEFLDWVDNDETLIVGVAGGFTHTFSIPEYTSDHVISYILGFRINNNLIPLFQILTEEHTESLFKRFLTEIMRDGFMAPNRILVDHLIFLCQAVIQTFSTNCTYEEFLMNYFTYLQITNNDEAVKKKDEPTKKKDVTLPLFQVVLNMKSVIANVSAWDFSDYPSSILDDCKNFVIKVIILLSQTNKLIDFERTLYKILVLTESKYETALSQGFYNEFSEASPLILEAEYESESSFQYIHKVCKRNVDFIKCKAIVDFLKSVRTQVITDIALENSPNLIDNALFNTTITVKILELCVEFVAWTKVMDPVYNFSSKSLSHFNTMEKYSDDFQTDSSCHLPMNIDDYLLKSIDYTEKKLNFASRYLASIDRDHEESQSVNARQDDNIRLQEVEQVIVNNQSHDLYPVVNNDYLNINEDLNISLEVENQSVLKQSQVTRENINDQSKCAKQDRSHLKPQENWKNLNYISDVSDDYCSSESESMDFLSEFLSEEESTDKNIDGIECLNNNMSIDANPTDVEVQLAKEKRPPKKRGKLLTPFPQFNLVQQMPKQKSMKRSVIRNANSMKVIKVDGEFVHFLTTSPIDSLTEVLVTSFYSISKFQTFMQGEAIHNTVLKEITDYSIDLKVKKFYNKRAQMLSKIFFEVMEEKLYWDDSMALFIEKTLIPCINQIIKCLICGRETVYHMSSIKVDLRTLSKHTKIADSFRTNIERYCTFCGNIAIVDFQIQNYLFCDVEPSKEEKTHNLYDIPIEVSWNNAKLILTGVIAFEDGLKLPVKHYVAFCRNFCSETWTRYDDSSTYTQTCTKNNADVHLAVLIYIEYESKLIKDKQQPDVSLPKKHNASFEEKLVMHTEVCDKDTSPKEIDDNEIFNCSTDRNLKNDTTLTDMSTSDIEIINVPTSTPERRESFINADQIVPSSLQQSKKIAFTKLKEKKQSLKEKSAIEKEKPKRQFTWNEVELATVKLCTPAAKLKKVDELNILNEKKSTEPARQLIRNGSRHIEKIIFNLGKLTFNISKFKNTCAYDSILEILTDMALSNHSIARDIQKMKTKNVTLSAINNYCEKFDMNELVLQRAKLLLRRHCSPDDSLEERSDVIIDCRTNVCSLFQDLTYTFPCLTIYSICSACPYKFTRYQSTVSINYIKFFEGNMINDLPELIQTELEDENTHCPTCIKKNVRDTVKRSYVLSNYLAIELEFMYEKSNEELIYNSTKREVNDLHANIRKLPLDITVKNRKFVLKGMIEFETPKNALMHYIGYSRCLLTNTWSRYDDTLTTIESIQSYQMMDMKIALLIYIAT